MQYRILGPSGLRVSTLCLAPPFTAAWRRPTTRYASSAMRWRWASPLAVQVISTIAANW